VKAIKDLVVCVATEMEGELLRPHVPVVCTGIGAVNAAYALTRFLDREPVKAVVVCGIGGAYPGSGIGIGSAVCAESECYGDLGADSSGGFLDMQALGFPVVQGASPLYNVLPMQIFPALRRTRFVTMNTCTGNDDDARAIEARTGGGVESMEGAAIAHGSCIGRNSGGRDSRDQQSGGQSRTELVASEGCGSSGAGNVTDLDKRRAGLDPV